jgi:hypothetical protein
MAKTPEAKVKEAVVKILKEYDVYYFFPVQMGMGRSGIPDIICCVDGNFLAVECKANGNKPTPLQERELAAITNHMGIALVVDEHSLTIVRDTLEELKGKE